MSEIDAYWVSQMKIAALCLKAIAEMHISGNVDPLKQERLTREFDAAMLNLEGGKSE